MRHVAGALLVAAVSGCPCAALAVDGSVAAIWGRGLSQGPDFERGVQLQLRHSAEFDDATQVKAEGRLRRNAAACSGRLEPDSCDAYRETFDWRELYLARRAGDWQISAGLQQVVWGRADALRVFDLVNPLDLRDYALPDLNDYRIAVPMLRALGPVGEWTLEALYLPGFRANRYAAAGSPFDMGIRQRFVAAGIDMLAERRPAQSLGNGELGALLSTTHGAVDLSLLAFSTWNDDPVYRWDSTASGAPAVRPEFRRQHLFGGSAAAALDGGWVVRGEATWSPDAPYSRLLGDGTTRAATLTGLLGLDYSWRDWMFTAQLSDRAIAGWQADFTTPRRAAIATLSATGTSLSGRLATRFALSWMPQNGDGSWVQLRGSYKLTDLWVAEAEVDLLDGGTNGYFGQFRERDRLLFGLRRLF